MFSICNGCNLPYAILHEDMKEELSVASVII